MDRYSSVDQGRALSTTFKVLSDEAQNIIAVYESALFAKSSPHVECELSQSLIFAELTLGHQISKRRKRLNSVLCGWLSLNKKQVVMDQVGR